MRNYLFLIVIYLLLFTSQLHSQIDFPYFNDFEEQADGWSSYAIQGQNNWELNTPLDFRLDEAYSGEIAWVTNATSDLSDNSIMALETPNFNISGANKPLVLSFRSRYHFLSSSNGLVEYSLDNGVSWLNLTQTSALSSNWYGNSSGFTGTNTNFSTYRVSKISLVAFGGMSQIKFRFVVSSPPDIDPGEGWAIDDFELREQFTDMQVEEKIVVEDFSNQIPDYLVDVRVRLLNDFFQPDLEMTAHLYFSKDSILDASDSLLWSETRTNTNSQSIEYLFENPSDLSVGSCYLLYQADPNNTIEETNENNNIGVIELDVDTTIVMGSHNVDWEEEILEEIWEISKQLTSQTMQWEIGSSTDVQIEGAHSGENSLFINEPNSSRKTNIESPYLDFSNSENNYICFWYQVFSDYPNSVYNFNILLSKSESFHNWSNNANLEQYEISFPRTKDWDCTCQNLSFVDQHFNSKVRLEFIGNANSGGVDQINIDDLYIGPGLPDLSIDDKKERYVTNTAGTKQLNYRLFNGGPISIGNTTTAFYWSNDEIFDSSDILLGEQMEATINDTTFIDAAFQFNLPTSTAGQYYILYKLDSEESITEIWESNNTGSIEIHVEPLESVPHFNDFEVQAENWNHYSTAGQDDWQWTIPNGTLLEQAFSGEKAWITQPDGIISPESRMHLVSPSFNLSNLENPVLEFDMLLDADGSGSCSCYNANMNMSYSVDGGYTWELLDTTNMSFKQWYSFKEYNGATGRDHTDINSVSTIALEDVRETCFPRTQIYQGRDIYRSYHNVLDITFLKDYESVKFRYNIGTDNRTNSNDDKEGALIDNFSIQSATTDLRMLNEKVIFSSNAANEIIFYVEVLNDGNYYALPNQINFYLSSDSLLSNDDLLLAEENLGIIQPEFSEYASFKYSTPSNFQDYGFLIYQIDPNEAIIESNEDNNVGSFQIISEGINQLPYSENFDEDYVYGWNNYAFLQGVYQRSHSRIRNKLAPNEESRFYKNNEMKTDRPARFSSVTFPFQYLETPIFDFSSFSGLNISFDLFCAGNDSNFDRDGGTIQYSLDGGNNWATLEKLPGTEAENWFNSFGASNRIWDFTDQTFGWSEDGLNLGGSTDYLTPRALDISRFVGLQEVQFRFKFGSNTSQYGFGTGQGFKLDNFQISGGQSDYSLSNIPSEIVANVQDGISVNFLIDHNGTDIFRNSDTYFYLSEDDVLNPATDSLVAIIEVANGSPNSSIGVNTNITINQNILQNNFFLFISIDGDNVINETNEDNNIAQIPITFNDHINYKASNGFQTLVTSQDQITIPYEIFNASTLQGNSSSTKFYWSENMFLDPSDILLGESIDDPVNANETVTSAFTFDTQPITANTVYIIYQIDANNDLVESNESDNVGIIKLDFEFVNNNTPTVLGSFYFDENENQSFDINEFTLGRQEVNLLPNNFSNYSDESGLFYYFLQNGEYMLVAPEITNWELTSPDTIPFSVSFNHTTKNIGYIPVNDTLAFELDLIAGTTRCSEIVPFWLNYRNIGTERADGVVSIQITEPLIFINANPSPDSISGNQYYWMVDSIAPFQENDNTIKLEVKMPDENTTGQLISIPYALRANANFSQSELELNPTFESIIRCSYDPNDKLVQPQREDNNFTLFEEELLYTIRFQNTGNDTAFLVTIKDTLSEFLDWSTFRPLSSSHNYRIEFDRNLGELEFIFENINLPDSTTNLIESQGFIKYGVFSRIEIAENTEIFNRAGIFFDFNSPIITNTTINEMVTELPTSVNDLKPGIKIILYPNPNNGKFSLILEGAPTKNRFMELRNSIGQLIAKTTWPIDQEIFQFENENLDPGLYFITVKDSRSGLTEAFQKVTIIGNR